MAKQKTETLNFDSFSGYYASIPQGYGGFNWGDVDYMNATFWQNEMTNWCDTGYQNTIHGPGEALTWNNNGSTSYGLFESPDVKTTSFTLKSMVAASAWETNQPFDFRSYTYTKKHGYTLKASNTVYLSQSPQTLKFAKIGNPGDFTNIVAVEIVSGTGQYGNTCTYGPYGYTTGNEMVFDNMKVKWNATTHKSLGNTMLTGFVPHGQGQSHAVTAHVTFGSSHHGAISGDAAVHSGVHAGGHSPLSPIAEPHSGDLSNQFHLPTIEHFGT